MFKWIIHRFILVFLSCNSLAFSAVENKNFFHINQSGPLLLSVVNYTLCLNVHGKKALTCQNYTTMNADLTISPVISNQLYRYAGIKVNTLGYTTGSPPNASVPGYVYLGVMDSNNAAKVSFSKTPKTPQTTLSISSSATTIAYQGTTTLSTTGGSGSGLVTYTVVTGSANCRISGSTLTGTSPGACTVTATKAADPNYNAASSSPIPITITQAAQATLTLQASATTIANQGTTTLSTTGGSGTGAVTYTVVTGSANCSISGSTLTGTSPGACTVTATKAADPNYNAASSSPISMTITQAAQATLTVQASATTIAYQGTTILSTTGGSGTGAVTYTVATGAANCSISGSTLTAIGAGTCTITATKAADPNYNAATSSPISITITQATQAILTVQASVTTIVYQGTTTLSTTGGSGTGAVSYTVVTGSANCSLSGLMLTGTNAGTCTVIATKAADVNYSAITSTSISITINKANQSISFISTAPTTAFIGSPVYTVAATGGGSGNPVTFTIDAASTSGACSIHSSGVSFAGEGSCIIAANQVGNANYNDALGQTQTINIIAVTVPGFPQSVTATPGNGSATISWMAPNNSSSISLAGFPITGYQVTSTVGAYSCSVNNATICTISGLNNGASYTFKVTALSAVGPGPVAYSSPVTPIGTISANPSTLALSGLGSGLSRIITITNQSASDTTITQMPTTSDFSPALPSGTTLSSTTCSSNKILLANGGSCTITISPGSTVSSSNTLAPCTTGVVPEPSIVTVVTSSASVTANVVVLGYACQYQGGYLFAIDDSTSSTSSIGGKVASTLDQAAQSATNWTVDNISLWGIDDSSTLASPSPNASSPQPATLQIGQLNCEAINDGACATNNVVVSYGLTGVIANNAFSYCVGTLAVGGAGYTDWYLPSVCELGPFGSSGQSTPPYAHFVPSPVCLSTTMNIQTQLANVNIGGLSGYYWASTEFSAGSIFNTFSQYLTSNGTDFQQAIPKNTNQYGVRCVRSLTL